MAEKGMDLPSLLDEAVESGLRYALDIGILPDDNEQRRTLTAAYPWILHSTGIYPGASDMDTTGELLQKLESALQKGGFAALGEIGLDFHWNYGTSKQQTDLFIEQINIANAFKLPVIIHNREADELLVKTIREHTPHYGGIMHCFSSDYETAVKCIDCGLSISFAGNITYKNAEKLRNTAQHIPLSSLLVETDAPYLSPVPFRGKKNHPKLIEHTYRFIANIRQTDIFELQEAIVNNFLRIVGRN